MIQQCPHFPVKRTNSVDPPASYARFREESPVVQVSLWNGDRAWLVTRYDDVMQVLRDHESFSNRPAAGYPTWSPGRETILAQEANNFLRMDPPEHTPRRRMLTGDFTMKRALAAQPRMEQIVDGLLDRMEAKGPPADIVADLAHALPLTIICEFLGLEGVDHEFILERTRLRRSLSVDAATARRAHVELLEYLDAEFQKIARRNDESVIGNLIRKNVDPGIISYAEAEQMVETVLGAAHETTASTTTLGVLLFTQHPHQWRQLHDNRDLMASAVNEVLRYLTVNHLVGTRLCKKDTIVGDQPIKAGEGVIASIVSANMDEAVFPDAIRFDITRNPTNHMTFGFGAHQCLGQNLARVELSVVFNRLLDRMPGIHLAVPPEELEFRQDSQVFSVKSLPVRW
jgi:cytochrome P450